MEANGIFVLLLLLILLLLLLLTALTLYVCYKTAYRYNNKEVGYSNQIKPMKNADIERDGEELQVMKNWMYAQQLVIEEYSTYRIGLGTHKQVAVSLLENLLHNLYNVRVKLDCRDKPFQIDTELPIVCGTTTQAAEKDLMMRLNAALRTDSSTHAVFVQLIQRILSAESVTSLHNAVVDAMKQAHVVVTQSGLDRELYGTVPGGHIGYFSASAINCSEFLLEWDRKSIQAAGLVEAVQVLLQVLRKEHRQPSYFEYIALQFAYFEMKRQNYSKELGQNARFLGTPGFRPDTQSYMSLTDPGDGHVMGTTKKSDWMRGAIIHVEHLERPNHDPRSKIESYRIPSILDFCKVRLHVGEIAPTTSFMGRRVKDSDDGDFDRDFVKIVHLTSAACTAMFQNGAAECKIAMEGLSTSQAVRYMRALLAQTMRSHKQVLSAAWNLNQTILDDYDSEQTTTLNTRMAIARRAIEITCIGGFEKVTWDGASDTYPSQCIMYQFSEQEALTIIHEAHERGLITYVSSGFKFAEIELAIYAGVDGVGIGGAHGCPGGTDGCPSTCYIEGECWEEDKCDNECFGGCGDSCDCWSWVCGDCDCHCLCQNHDYFCSCVGNWEYECYALWEWIDDECD